MSRLTLPVVWFSSIVARTVDNKLQSFSVETNGRDSLRRLFAAKGQHDRAQQGGTTACKRALQVSRGLAKLQRELSRASRDVEVTISATSHVATDAGI
jgi:hypothetical protein